MAEIALPRQAVNQTPQSAGVGSPLYQRRHQSNGGPIELLPNPHFSFPMRDPESTLASSAPASNARPMSLQAYPTGRRGSSPAVRMKSVSALPDFSFNPAGATAETSPPHSPNSPARTPTTPSRPIGGHRRGGSEFIGGDGRTGGTTLLSTSPTKGDGMLPAPTTNLHPGLSAGRRGHAHRRSGAVSSHDLSSMMNPPAHPRAGSAPATPAEGAPFVFGHSVNKSMSQPSLRDTKLANNVDSTPRPPSRADTREVRFQEQPEYIRPLSTISSETETSMSTVRGGHSATNSLSSVISGASSPQASRSGRLALSTSMEGESRPSTAGAILDMHRGARSDGDPVERKRPSSAASSGGLASPSFPTVPAKRRSFFRLDSKRSDPSVHTLSSAVSDPALSKSVASPLPSPMPTEDGHSQGSDKTKHRKTQPPVRKVKSWAHSIKKKARNGKKAKSRVPTPPAGTNEESEDTDESDDMDIEAIFDADVFDADNTVTIVSPDTVTIPDVKTTTDYSSWQPRELKRVDSDTMTPVIDLDAALGPFNTPNGTSPRTHQRGFAAHRRERTMHSGGGLTQNHRRTESAPALAPFEMRNSSVATPTPMADVFEEEEPEDEASRANEKPGDDEEPKIQIVETDGNQSGSAINWNFNDGLGIRREKTAKAGSEPVSPLSDPVQLPNIDETKQVIESTPVEVVEDFEEPRTSSLTHSSDSTVTPQLAPIEVKDSQAELNFSLPLPQQNLMTPDTVTSSFSSPDFRSSQISLDTPRLGTAASSLTDYPAMPSPRFGEPGPELRVSVDDVPSLTSSRSTMTSAMQNGFPLPSPRRPGERSVSLCSGPSDTDSRRRKRSSIASLSRLINNSSFGERSKLSIEHPVSDCHESPHKESKKKHKRLSKLMQFWKSKDSAQPS